MATQIKNIVRFIAAVPGIPVVLPHGLNIDGTRNLVPDIVIPNVPGFDVTADAINVTVTNNGPIPTGIDVFVDAWHTITREFGASNPLPGLLPDGSLTPQPFVLDYDGGAATQKFPPSRTIVVDPSGPVTTIAAGIAAASALVPPPSVSPAVVWVAPSIYVESPLTVPVGVVVASLPAKNEAAVIVAAVTTSPLVTVTPGGRFSGFTLTGASGVGGEGLRFDTANPFVAIVDGVTILDCETGVHATGAGVNVAIIEVQVIRAPGSAGITALLADSGADLTAVTANVVGSAGAMFTDGVRATGAGSRLTPTSVQVAFCVDGLDVDDGATIEAANMTIEDSTIGAHVGATGTGGNLRTIICVFDRDTTDILIDGSNGFWTDSASIIDESKRVIASGATVGTVSLSESPATGETAVSILGELHVGAENFPSQSAFGGGDSHIRGEVAFRSVSLDAGPFTDITAAVTSPTGSTAAIFDTGIVGNTFFLGGDVIFPYCFIDTTTAIALGAGALITEISDGGGGWIAVDLCVCDTAAPFLSHAQDIFGRVASENARVSTVAGWAAQIINGVSKFWLRIRIVTAAITTIPIIEFTKLGTNNSTINADGVIESFGTGEQERTLIWHQNLMDDLTGASPGNATINFSTNIPITPVENSFANGAVDGVGGIAAVPEGLDTSRAVDLVFRWIPAVNTAGDVEFETDLAEIEVGDVLDGTLADVHDTLIAVVGAGQLDTLRENSFAFSITELEPGDQFAFSLFRDASGGNPDDTLGGAIEFSTRAALLISCFDGFQPSIQLGM